MSEMSVPIFSQPWWMAIAAQGADVKVEAGTASRPAALHVAAVTKGPLRILQNAPLSPYVAVLTPTDGLAATQQISRTHEAVEAVVSALPPHDLCKFRLAPGDGIVQPWVWAGFQTRATSTYRLDLRPSPDEIFSRISKKTRRDIRKASASYQVGPAEDAEAVAGLVTETMDRKGRGLNYPRSVLVGLINEALERGVGRALAVSAGSNHPLGAAFMVWDDDAAYYLAGGMGSGGSGEARRLLLWEMIRSARPHAPVFDFEGSMIPGVEFFMRQFGATPTPVVTVSRTAGRLELVQRIRSTRFASYLR